MAAETRINESDRIGKFRTPGLPTEPIDRTGLFSRKPDRLIRPGKRPGRWKRIGLAALAPGLILIGWWVLGRLDLLNTFLTPTLESVWRAMVESLIKGELIEHAGVSLGRVFIGFAVTCAAAMPLAALIRLVPVLEQLLAVPLEFIRVVPPLAAAPLLILWFGIGEGSKLAVIVLASFFPVFLNARNGLKNVDPKLLELARTIDLTNWETLRHILLPSALPMVITGLRIGFGYSWRALIGAEMIAAAAGLGYMILDAEELARTDRVFVGILVIGGLGYLFDALFSKSTDWLSRRLHLAKTDPLGSQDHG